MGNRIKSFRSRYHVSAAELAEQLGVSKTELSQFERGWKQPPPAVVRDVALRFECGAVDVLGEEIPVEDWRRRSPYAAGNESAKKLEPYGDFGFAVGKQQFTFPISTSQHEALLMQFQSWEPGRDDDEVHKWLTCSTLNNRILFLSPGKIRRLWMKSDDDEEISYFAHPEVYRAVDDQMFEREDPYSGPLLRRALAKHVEYVGAEEAEKETALIRLYDDEGLSIDDDLYMGDDAALTSLFALDANSFRIEPNTMLLVDHTSYHVADYVNLSHTAFIEVPKERYLRYSAPDDLPANDDADED